MEEFENSTGTQEAVNVSTNENRQESHSDAEPSNAGPVRTNDYSSNDGPSPSTSERMMSQAEHQEELNRVVGAVKQKERERAKSQYSQNPPQNQNGMGNQQAQPDSNNQGGVDIALEVDKALKAKQEEIETREAYSKAQNIISGFSQKIVDGKDKYEDFDDKMSTINLGNPDLVMSLHELDNPADVLYAMGEDPTTYLEIVNGLSSPYTAAAAKAKVHKIANVIKNKQEARGLHNTSKIPSKIKSSPLNTGSGRASYSDMLKSKSYQW